MHIVKYLNSVCHLSKNIISLILLFFITSCTTFEKADKIYINGNIYTGIETDTRYNYIAIKDDIILSLGLDTYHHLIYDSTIIIDLNNNFTLPGFIDNHTHLMWGGATLRSINLKDINEKDKFIARRLIKLLNVFGSKKHKLIGMVILIFPDNFFLWKYLIRLREK